MKILLTGHNGYIGSVMHPFLRAAGHEVVGLDAYLFEDCTFGPPTPDIPSVRIDVRDVERRHLEGYDAVIHLAALSNDPLGNLNPETTYEINHRASTRLGELAKAAGVPRFLFASSCSLYGVAGDDFLDESAAFNPITAYGHSKVLVEQDLSKLADDSFSPIYFRNATAYGWSPRLRCDVVVNSLVASAVTTGDVYIQSDGTPWRPLVHVQDICRAFLAALEAPRELVHNRAFNVGRTQENYRVREVAEIVQMVVPGSRVRYADNAGPDPRCYRVNCDLIGATLPGFQPQWNVRRGVEELYAAFQREGVTQDNFEEQRYLRQRHIRKLLDSSRLDQTLRWSAVAAS